MKFKIIALLTTIFTLINFNVVAQTRVVVIPLAGDDPTVLFERTVIVKGSGSHAENGQALVDARDYVVSQAPSITDPWLIKLEPGIFDLTGLGTLELLDGMSLAGSGAGVSKVILNFNTLFIESSFTMIRDLTIEQTSGNSFVVTAHANSNLDIINTVLLSNGARVIQSSVPSSSDAGSGIMQIKGSTLRLNNGNSFKILDTRQTVIVESSRLLGLEADGSGVIEPYAGVVTIMNSYIEDESTSTGSPSTGSVVCRGIAAPSNFYTNSCP